MAIKMVDAERVDVDGMYARACDEAARSARFARMAQIKLEEVAGECQPEERKYRLEELDELLDVLVESSLQTRSELVALEPHIGRCVEGA